MSGDSRPPSIVSRFLVGCVAIVVGMWLLSVAIDILARIWPVLLGVAVVAVLVTVGIVWWRNRA